MKMDHVCGKGPLPAFSPQPVLVKVELNGKKDEEDESLKNLKVSYQSIKHLFPKCRVKLSPFLAVPANDNQKTDGGEADVCSVSEDKPRSSDTIVKLERQALKENEYDCFKTEIPKPEVSPSPRLSDIFIDVEWDTERGKPEVVKNDPNVKVQEILVLRPKWIGKDCKKVVFSDLHVNLHNFKEEEKLVRAYLEKRRKQQTDASCPVVKEEKEDAENQLGDPSQCQSQSEEEEEEKGKNICRKPDENEAVREPGTRLKHKCELCGKSFRLRALLFKHLIVHLGEKPYKCDDCGKRLRTLDKLKTHIRVHTGERPFSCPSCEKRFKQREHLNSHVRLIHDEQRNDLRAFFHKIKKSSYECTKCKERFKQLYQLKIHVAIMHSGGNCSAYCCKTCGKYFAHSASLTDHVKRGPCKKGRHVKLKTL